ncbi:hypothetical protein ILYODFUR_023751 [Ilyodon furcidens]|uniref:Uncharacterized protein n=1 Tax=Ilyodon furcidens TaxID=33524 RepID=A0ABV0T108_9TELE
MLFLFLTKLRQFFIYNKNIKVKYNEEVAADCLACKPEEHGFPEMTAASLNEVHRCAAYQGLFLESVNNRCLTRKRIPSVTLSNRGLALFLKLKRENTTKKHRNFYR